MKTLLSLLCLVMASQVIGQKAFTRTDGEECYRQKIVDYEEEHPMENDPGFALAVFTSDSLLIKYSAGTTKLGDVERISLDTPFFIASLSKSFTAAAILNLAEDGKLSLDDRISKHLEVPGFMKQVRLRHLLNHSSGLPEYTEGEDWIKRIRNNSDVLNFLKKSDSLKFPSGTKFSYNNTGYVLLAGIIEKITGKSFKEYITKSFLEPLDMKNTWFSAGDIPVARAIGYEKTEEGSFRVSDTENYGVSGSTGMYSSVNDLIKWTRAFEKNLLISEYIKNQMFTYPVSDSGKQGYMNMGWFNETLGKHAGPLEGFPQDGMIGVNSGFRAYLIKARNHDFNYIVLSNRGELPFELIGKSLVSCFFSAEGNGK